MGKRGFLLVIVIVTGLASATPVLAAGPRRGGERNIQRNDPPYFTLVGTVNGTPTYPDIVVTVHQGNRFVKEWVGLDVAVQVIADTEYRRWTPAGCIPAEWADVEDQVTISIHGLVIDDLFVAERVTVDVPLLCCSVAKEREPAVR